MIKAYFILSPIIAVMLMALIETYLQRKKKLGICCNCDERFNSYEKAFLHIRNTDHDVTFNKEA